MSLETRVTALAAAIGAEIKGLREQIGASGSLVPVSGSVNLPSVPVGSLRGYRLTGATTFTAPDASTLILPAGEYVLEFSPSGWLAHALRPGTPFTALFADDFETPRTDLYGTPTPIGGAAWFRGLFTPMGYSSASLQMKAENGYAIHSAQTGSAAFISTGWLNMSIEIDYDVSGNSGQSVRVAGRGDYNYTTADRSAMPVQAVILGTGALRFEPFWNGTAWSFLELGTGQPTVGIMRLELVGSEARVLINGSQVGATRSLDAPQQVGAHAGFLVWSGGRVGGFRVERMG